MKFDYALVPALTGIAIASIQPQIAIALSSAEVAKLAKAITVQIDYKDAPGSGVIIQKEGNIYTVLTAQHVVQTPAKYDIVTPDGQRYALKYSTVKKLPNIDLAVVQFTSSQSYAVAKMGNSDESPEGTTTYVAGFPQATAAISNTIYNFTDGRITANASKPLRDGYALVYSNVTLPGMSGGPVLNEKGELIGIHGRGDEADIETSKINSSVAYIKSGFNLGIPINTFLRLSAKVGVNTGVSPPKIPVVTAPKADDFYIQGGSKYDRGDLNGAVADFTNAIKINPKYFQAYNNRGVARSALGDKQGAITDFNQALKINPNYTYAYIGRGNVRDDLGEKQQAIADYTQALKLNPNFVYAHYNRGITRSALGDKQGAIADFTTAIKIDPNFANAYNNRGVVRNELQDPQQAIADFNQALKINPNFAQAYYNRGVARSALGDKQAAIADYTQAIKLNPNDAQAYNNRGNARSALGDKQGAIEDYNQGLKINPNDAYAYNNRGVARFALGDTQGAVADLQQAANLFRTQGNEQLYRKTLNQLERLTR
ncbi:MAG: tetratricopeptide repeat protein [Desmonostoc vinosum HA7617-LM4]|jgi:tetratricopeptide (TPR) repeat protein/V8-like Glu-specific endopeptidase|nr:tetratricopeptide repeat protein [Desmonostoc vinosum HA7617-LM4]